MSTTSRTVLLLENGLDDGGAAEALEAAGHTVRRCHEGRSPSNTVGPAGWVPCTAMTGGSCPLDEPVDVALLAKGAMTPWGAPANGIGCAVRSGVPVVEEVDGDVRLGPAAPWIDRRAASEDVVREVEVAAEEAFLPVLAQLRERARVMLEEVGVDPADIEARFDVDGDTIAIRVSGPPLPRRVAETLCERATASLSVLRRAFRIADASYQSTDAMYQSA